MTTPPSDSSTDEQRWRTRIRRARRARRVAPAQGRPRPGRDRPGDRTGRPLHDASGPAGGRGPGRRRVRALAADPDALLQHRRRRRGGDLARRHPLLHGAVGRGARPGGALPRPDDAAVRDRGAADRAVPRPLRPRPPLGDRRDDGDPGLPGAGCSPGRSSPTRRGSSRPRSACSSRPRRTASRGPPPYPGCSPATSRWSRPTAGCRCRASSAWPCRRRSPGSPPWPGRSGCCATRSCSSSPRRSRRSGCRRGSTPARARATCCCAAGRGPGPHRAASGSRRRSPTRCAPTAVRGGCRAS